VPNPHIVPQVPFFSCHPFASWPLLFFSVLRRQRRGLQIPHSFAPLTHTTTRELSDIAFRFPSSFPSAYCSAKICRNHLFGYYTQVRLCIGQFSIATIPNHAPNLTPIPLLFASAQCARPPGSMGYKYFGAAKGPGFSYGRGHPPPKVHTSSPSTPAH